MSCFGLRRAAAETHLVGVQPASSRLPAPAVLLESVLNALKDALVVRNAAGAVIFENRAHQELSVSPEAAYVATHRAVLGPDAVLNVFTPVSAAAARAPLEEVLLDALPNIIYTVRGRGTALTQNFTLNRHFQKLFPLPDTEKEAVLVETQASTWAKQYADSSTLHNSRAMWARAMASGGIYEQEVRAKARGSDTYRWYLSRAVPVSFDADGGSSHYIGTITDIDDQKKAQEALQQMLNERKLFEAVLEQLPVALCIARPTDGRVIFANKRADPYMAKIDAGSHSPPSPAETRVRIDAGSRSIGAPPNAPLSEATVPPSPADPTLSPAPILPVTPASGRLSCSATSLSGSGASLWGSARALTGPGAHTHLDDMSRNEVAEGTDGLVLPRITEADLFSSVIARARRLADTSFSEDIVILQPRRLLQHGIASSPTIEEVSSSSSAADQFNKPLPAIVTCTKVLDSGGTPQALVVVVEDTSRQHEAERVQRASQAVRGAFANMSHELRTPLNAVLGFAELLQMITRKDCDSVSEEEPHAGASGLAFDESNVLQQCGEYARGIHESGKLLLRIINDILDYMRSDSDSMQLERAPFNLRQCMQLVENMMTHEAHKRGVTLRVTAGSSVPPLLLGDSVRVSQVLVNLLSNALKFTRARGQVSCTASIAASAAAPAARVHDVPAAVASAASVGGVTLLPGLTAPHFDGKAASSPRAEAGGPERLRVEVRDTGIGISPAVLPRLFTPFSQADASTTRQYGGTGLGLSICKQLVELMGGTVGVSSVLGEGSTFWFEIPVIRAQGTSSTGAPSTPAPVIADAAAEYPPARDPASLRLLLAEDNIVNVRVCTRILKHLGYTDVTVVTDGEQAVRAVAEASPPFALCLMDCQMPVCDGLEATRRIRALPDAPNAATPIVALSAGVLEHDVAECLRAGMQAHVAKPVVSRLLTAAIRRWAR